jgi:hypothetical protein
MLQTELVEKIRTHILCSITFPKNRNVLDNVEKYGRARQATNDSMAHKRCHLHARQLSQEYKHMLLTLTAFQLQPWLCKGTTILYYTYIDCLALRSVHGPLKH